MTDGVSFGVEEDNSLRVVREVLEAIHTQPVPKPTPGLSNPGVQHEEQPEGPWT